MRRPLTALGLFLTLFVLGATPAWAAGPVTIPSDYVYAPERGARHDYCTSSYDYLPVEDRQLHKGVVDNRGPCARHDLCYDGTASKSACDGAFHRDLLQQCDHTFPGDRTGFRDICRTRAQTYYVAVYLRGNADL